MSQNMKAIWWAPSASLNRLSAARLRHAMQAGSVCFIPRVINSSISHELDRLNISNLQGVDVSDSTEKVLQVVSSAISCLSETAAELSTWLRGDIFELVELFAETFQIESLRVRLYKAYSDSNNFTRVDSEFYLITHYKGIGMELISDTLLAEAVANHPLWDDAIHPVDRGTVVVVRGHRSATLDQPGMLHRFPIIAGPENTRLVLIIGRA